MDEDTLIKQKEKSWRRYDYLLAKLNTPRKKKLSGELITEFCRLHREVCSDLSCAVSTQRSEGVIRYLHTLVGRGHAQLYRFEKVRIWGMRQILREMSARLYYDNCFRLALVIFYGSFAVSMLLGSVGDNFCAALIGEDATLQLEKIYSYSAAQRSAEQNVQMSGYYIQHNTSLALQCFAGGIFLGLGSIYCLLFNGVMLGAAFGHMLSGPYSDNFLAFVLSHGPFELTGIAVAGGAGLKLGYSMVRTNGLTRLASLRQAAHDSVPLVVTTAALISSAAMIEGFWSPLDLPLFYKAAMGALCTLILFVFIVVLGRKYGEPRSIQSPRP